MNIKSLLLGSAAALVAVSGARAADAVVMAEPEPMEYVRVCDTYGAGYYYIPGTETCLHIGGYVRAEISGGEFFERRTTATLPGGQVVERRNAYNTYNTLARFGLLVDANSETEYGTLKAHIETRFNYSNGGNDVGTVVNPIDPTQTDTIDDTGVSLNFAWIELAGFRIGKDESLFTTWTGYAGGVMTDGIVPYGPFDTLLISYTADFGNGFSAAVSVEEGDQSDELNSYVPHVVGGLKYDGGMFAVAGVAAYDANNEEFAGKVRVDVRPTEEFSFFVMGGYKTDDGDDERDSAFERGNDGTNYYGQWSGDNDDEEDDDGFAVWGGFTYKLSPMLAINTEVDYDEGENFGAVANVDFEPVKDLHIIPEVVYNDNFDDDRVVGSNLDNDDDGVWGGRLRFQRNF